LFLYSCEIKNGQSFNYGFLEFDDKRDAEDVKKAHEDKEVFCMVMIV
jgi:RNA recognition motif-containing protein